MEYTYLESFIKISEYMSFSKAANALGYTQSALSIQMSKLEKELGVPLFEKFGKQIYLTPYGKTFLDYAADTLRNEQLLKQTLSEYTNSISGSIVIAVAHSLCSSEFSSVLIDFHKKYPDVNICIRSGLTDNFINWLMHNEIDLIYTLDQKIYRPEFITKIEDEISIGFFVNSHHPLASRKRISIDDINKYPLYLTEKGLSYRKLLEEQLADINSFVSAAIEIGDTNIIKRLLLSNDTGIGFIPEFIVREELADKSVVRLNVSHVDIKMYKQLIYHKKKTLTPAAKELMSVILHYDEKILNNLRVADPIKSL